MKKYLMQEVAPGVLLTIVAVASVFLFDVVRFIYPVTKFVDYSINYIPMVFLLIVLLADKNTILNLPRVFVALFFGFSLALTTIMTNFIEVRSWLFIMPLSVIIWFVILPESTIDKDDIKFLLRIILYIAFLYCAANAVIHYDKMFSFWLSMDPYKNNIQGVYFNKNMWGQLMLPLLFFNMLYINICSEKEVKSYALFGILVYTLLASLSRAAILAFAIFFILNLFLLMEKRHLKRLLVVVSLLTLVMLGLWLLPSLHHFWTDYFFRSHDILTFRDKLWAMAWSYVPGMPIWGYGLGSEMRLISAHGIYLGAFHNTYIDWYMQGGPVFLCSNFLIWGLGFYQICKLYRIEKHQGAVFLAAFIAMSIYCNVEYIPLYTITMPNVLFCLFFLALPRLLFRLTRNDIMGT